MSEYNNLSGTADFDVEVPYGDDMVYNLKLKDKTTGEYLDLTGNTFALKLYRSDTNTNQVWSVAGTLTDDETARFEKAITLRPGYYYYRIYKTDGDDITTTPIRGQFKVS